MPKKQSSGLYRAKVKIGVNAAGEDVYKYISAPTKGELEQRRQEAIDFYIEGTGFAQDVLFGPYAQKWYNIHKKPHVSVSSQESYRTALNKDILPVFEWRHLRSIPPSDLQDFLNRYKGMSQTKLTVLTSTLQGIFDTACGERILAQNPMAYVKKPKAAKSKEREILDPKMRPVIEEVCRTHPQGAYLAALYYLGGRPGEIRGLQWGDFNEDFTQVHIQRDIDYKAGGKAGDLKTEKSDRWVPVPEPLKALLEPHKGPVAGFCFHGERNLDGPIAKATGERLWVDFMLQAGLVEPVTEEEAKRYNKNDIRRKWKATITPYVLRHNYVTMCWENGIDPYTTMRLAGHTSIKTTMDIYTHLSEQRMAKVKQQVDTMFGSTNKGQQD